MKQTIMGIAIVSTLVFTATAWSQDAPMEQGKMGMGKMGMEDSPQTKACMQMMGEMESTNAALDELVGRMQAAEGAEKVAAIEEVLTAMVAQRRETNKRMRNMPEMMCGGKMRMMMQ